MNGAKRQRDSGIELLKIIAVFIIVISHVVQTLATYNRDVTYGGYVLDISRATTDIQTVILLIFRHFGMLGNALFFISSAWFLLKSNVYNKKKWFFMFVEIWSVSMIILILTWVILDGNISTKNLIKSFLPTTFANNWYMTCYLLFYPIHPILNKVINEMDKITHFRCMLCLVILYIFLNFVKEGLFFQTRLMLWLTIYFVIAYMQKYLLQFADNIKANVLVLVFDIICFVGIIFLTEIVGLHISFLSGKMTYYVKAGNPFLIVMAVAMFNIARNIHFKNRCINYISSLTMLIYIIHENLILRVYFRPAIWNYIYTVFGYKYVVVWTLIFAVGVFLFGVIMAVIYSQTIRKIVLRVSSMLYSVLKRKYMRIEHRLLKIE